MPDDFEDVKDAERRVHRALLDRLDSAGLVIFDFSFAKKPDREPEGMDPRWGGYAIKFKIIARDKYEALGREIESIRRQSTEIGPEHQRVFNVEISKFEYCTNKTLTELDNFSIYVYTLPMIAIEKLRAICQQLPEYKQRGYRTPRARDFYDIHTIVTSAKLDLADDENLHLFKEVFAAKSVPLELLHNISNAREFHRADWDSVVASAVARVESFDYYFDFVLEHLARLKSRGVI